MVVDLGWVNFDLRVLPSDPAAQPLLPNSHRPVQSLADWGKLNIQSTQVYDFLGRPALLPHINELQIGCPGEAIHHTGEECGQGDK